MKILIYLISLIPVYFIYLIKTLDPIFGIVIIFSLLSIIFLLKELDYGFELSKRIDSFKEINYQFIAVVIALMQILVALTLDPIDGIIVYFVIGLVFIISDIVYYNALFLFYGIKIYKIERKGKKYLAISTIDLNKNNRWIEKKLNNNLILIQKL